MYFNHFVLYFLYFVLCQFQDSDPYMAPFSPDLMLACKLNQDKIYEINLPFWHPIENGFMEQIEPPWKGSIPTETCLDRNTLFCLTMSVQM